MLELLRKSINCIDVQDRAIASIVCKLIPASCPFTCTARVFGRAIAIPPLCKINPLYDDLMELRFKALEVVDG